MDATNHAHKEEEMQKTEDNHHRFERPSVVPFATLSLSLSSAIAPHFSVSKPASLSPPTASFKTSIAPNFSSKSSLSSSAFFSQSSTPIRRSSALNSSFSATTVAKPFRHLPGNSDNSPGGVYGRKTTIVWFRNDLRVHDNEVLSSADSESLSLIPVFVFDPQEETGAGRSEFLIRAVADLRQSLKKRGSELVVRMGKAENVLREIAKKVGADAVFAHREVSKGQVKSEAAVEAALAEEGVETKWFWGSTLFHLDDLPFKLDEMPSKYNGFMEKVKNVKVRKTIEAADRLKGFPATSEEIEPGRIPTLADLGFTKSATQRGKASLVGGETEALQKLKEFAAEYRIQPAGKNPVKNMHGANFSSKIAPWLSTGCLSPRRMFEELKKNAVSSVTASLKNSVSAAENGSSWLTSELQSRDFFRFVSRKCSSATMPSATATVAAMA